MGGDQGKIAIVISHDCDCVADISVESNIEIILAAKSVSDRPEWRHAKHPRRLQLPSSGGTYDLDIAPRISISKVQLASFRPDPSFVFSADSRRRLAQWLAARYDRGALPSELQLRLKVVEDVLYKAAKDNAEAIIGVYVDFDPDEELQLDSELYTVDLVIVYNSEAAGSYAAAQDSAVKIRSRFERKFKLQAPPPFRWSKVMLTSCEVLADTEFSLRDMLVHRLWRLEHVSLAQDPPTETSNLR